MGRTGGIKTDAGSFVMKTDHIREIKIDEQGRLCITPKATDFSLIYRSAMEVYWDENGKFLYSPKPREWSYFDWYLQILSATLDCSCMLFLTEKTVWSNVPDELKHQIASHSI